MRKFFSSPDLKEKCIWGQRTSRLGSRETAWCNTDGINVHSEKDLSKIITNAGKQNKLVVGIGKIYRSARVMAKNLDNKSHLARL